MEKYTKTSENQDLNDFVLGTLAWFNYHRRWLILNKIEFSLFPKVCRFWESGSTCMSKLLQWSSHWICKKKSGGLEKFKFEMDDHW